MTVNSNAESGEGCGEISVEVEESMLTFYFPRCARCMYMI